MAKVSSRQFGGHQHQVEVFCLALEMSDLSVAALGLQRGQVALDVVLAARQHGVHQSGELMPGGPDRLRGVHTQRLADAVALLAANSAPSPVGARGTGTGTSGIRRTHRRRAVELPPDPDDPLYEDGESEDQPPNVAVAPVPTGPPTPSPGQLAHWAVEEFERGLLREGWQWRYDDLSLRAAATRMRRSGDYAVMHHGRWLQAVPPRDSAAPLLIQIGPQSPDATFELEGSVSVTLGRFLHFAAQVWLRQAPPDAQAAPNLGRDESTDKVDSLPVDVDGSNMDTAGYVLLSESRRMRPGELHYLDHPWLGILVLIEPVDAPDALLARLQSLPEGIPTARRN